MCVCVCITQKDAHTEESYSFLNEDYMCFFHVFCICTNFIWDNRFFSLFIFIFRRKNFVSHFFR